MEPSGREGQTNARTVRKVYARVNIARCRKTCHVAELQRCTRLKRGSARH